MPMLPGPSGHNVKEAMKVLVPPTECEVSFSSGIISENYDATKRKLLSVEHTPLYKNDLKKRENT